MAAMTLEQADTLLSYLGINVSEPDSFAAAVGDDEELRIEVRRAVRVKITACQERKAEILAEWRRRHG